MKGKGHLPLTTLENSVGIVQRSSSQRQHPTPSGPIPTQRGRRPNSQFRQPTLLSLLYRPQPHIPFYLSLTINPVLHAERDIARGLEAATSLECPRHLARIAEEEKPHLHRVAEKPVGQHAEAEALAGAGAVVGVHLRQREGRFDGEAQRTEEGGVPGGVGGGGGEEEVERQEEEGEEQEELPVADCPVGLGR